MEGLRADLPVLLLLAAPNSFTYLINMAIPLISILFLGRIGEAELGAAVLGNMLANTTGLSVGLGLTMALDTLCSQAFGAQHYRLVGLHCQRYFDSIKKNKITCFISKVSFSRGMLILSVACIPILAIWSQTDPILVAIGVTHQVSSLASQWVWRLMPGLWPWLMFECWRRFLLAQRITWITTTSLLIVLCIHVWATWFLSIHLKWGLNGAAIAVTIANWLQFIIALLLYRFRALFSCCFRNVQRHHQHQYELTRTSTPPPGGEFLPATPPRSSSPMPFRTSSSSGSLQDLSSPQDTAFMSAPLPPSEEDTWPPITLDVLHGCLALPASISMVLEWGAYEVYAAIAAHLPGTVSLATHAVLCSTAGLWYMVPLGLATACAALVGNALGAGDPERAQRFTMLGLVVVVVYGTVNSSASLLYRRGWGQVWSPSREVQVMVDEMMPYMALYSFVDVIKCVGVATLRGTGRPTLAVWGNAVSSLLIGYPAALVMVFVLRLGLPAVWTSMSLGWLSASAFYCIILLRTNWHSEADAAAQRNQNALSSLVSIPDVVHDNL